ncbi:MAG TPA: hypothetical protein VF905_04645 [Nitrospirota bacterium]
MSIVAFFMREYYGAAERCPGLQLQNVAAMRFVERFLQVVPSFHQTDMTGSWGVGHGRFEVNARQLCRSIKSCFCNGLLLPMSGPPGRGDRSAHQEPSKVR